MCEWGNTITYLYKGKPIDVDKCIAPVVLALHHTRIDTVASCCGHGKQMGNIALEDGREILIVPDYETGRKIDKLFPPINPAGRANRLVRLAKLRQELEGKNKHYPVNIKPSDVEDMLWLIKNYQGEVPGKEGDK